MEDLPPVVGTRSPTIATGGDVGICSVIKAQLHDPPEGGVQIELPTEQVPVSTPEDLQLQGRSPLPSSVWDPELADWTEPAWEIFPGEDQYFASWAAFEDMDVGLDVYIGQDLGLPWLADAIE